MKKLIAALLTAALLTLGLVAATAGVSQAGYPHHKTRCSVLGSKHAKHGSAVGETVIVSSGAKGDVVIRITGPKGFSRTVHKKSFILGNVAKGTYHITVRFTGDEGWSNDTASATVVVK